MRRGGTKGEKMWGDRRKEKGEERKGKSGWGWGKSSCSYKYCLVTKECHETELYTQHITFSYVATLVDQFYNQFKTTNFSRQLCFGNSAYAVRYCLDSSWYLRCLVKQN